MDNTAYYSKTKRKIMSNKNWHDIKENEFQAFEDVRLGGLTNMWDTQYVAELSDYIINENQALTILSNYDKLNAKYPYVRGNHLWEHLK